MISKIYNSTKNQLKNFFNIIGNFPNFCKLKISEIDLFFKNLGYTLSNLTKVNLSLGKYHLKNGNLNDAIIRFKLVDKFFDPHNIAANYWLGITYFFKKNIDKADIFLKKSQDFDPLKFKPFFANYPNLSFIPKKIFQEFRDMQALHYLENFIDDKTNIANIFVKTLLQEIEELEDAYSILEIGSNIGLVGTEIKKYFPDKFTLKAIETSERMIDLSMAYSPNTYDEIIEEDFQEFLDQAIGNYNIIISLAGLNFSTNLKKLLTQTFSLLADDGYFGLVLRNNDITEFSIEYKELIFNHEEVKKAMEEANFSLLKSEKLTLGIKNKYSIFICKK